MKQLWSKLSYSPGTYLDKPRNIPGQTMEPNCTNWGNLKIPVMTIKIWAQHLPQTKQEPYPLDHHVLLKDIS